MDFFDMTFSTLFLDKHGESTFNNIKNQIMQENSAYYNNEYIEIIFKIAFLNFFGLASSEIKNMLKDIMPGIQLDIETIKSIHKESISKIQFFLRDTNENFDH